MGQIESKWDKSGTFLRSVSIHFGSASPIWDQSDPINLDSKSDIPVLRGRVILGTSLDNI